MRSEPEQLNQADLNQADLNRTDLNQTETCTELPLITSSSDPIRVDFLPDAVERLPGRLGMTIAPGKCNFGMHAVWQRHLDTDLRRLRQHYCTDLLVTLLQVNELTDLQIPDLFKQVQTYGMQTCWFPIHDFGTPNSMPALQRLVEQILADLAGGQTVVIHCKAGLGRTGLVTASCLVALGHSPEVAFKILRQARPGSVETLAQEAYVVEFAKLWQSAEPELAPRAKSQQVAPDSASQT